LYASADFLNISNNPMQISYVKFEFSAVAKNGSQRLGAWRIAGNSATSAETAADFYLEVEDTFFVQ
jgi:hypothetical protein